MTFGQAMNRQEEPVDFAPSEPIWAGMFNESVLADLRAARIRCCVPLLANKALLGWITLDERMTKEPFSREDFDLLKTIADQAGANLLNVRLSEQLLQAKEMEIFQTISAFLVHDLKNLAPILSLTVENLRTHFDDADFRRDAMRGLSGSVDKINSLCSRLSQLAKRPELNMAEVDLNSLVATTLASLNGSLKVAVRQDLGHLSKVLVDPEEMQKVLLNLLLNSNEALNSSGEIQVVTQQKDGWVTLLVRDNGCGMSREFVMQSLFHPLQTTKTQGLGIGLFQSKKIVEAHDGKIKVESEQGKGTTFEVLLPPHMPGISRLSALSSDVMYKRPKSILRIILQFACREPIFTTRRCTRGR
jgi:putative PEP-CTERM system histidine kinase